MLSQTLHSNLTALLPDKDTPYALAYSGGGDSLALLQALAGDPRLKAVLHVDHGLREASAKDAILATLQAESLGRSVEVLKWSPGSVKTGLQAKARRARYRLMGDWCRAHRIDNLVVAHHADDQAETVLMRIDRGTGWRGAAGMRAISYGPVWPELAGITLLRPALSVSRETLRSELGTLRPLQDPSNENLDFARVRARKRLANDPALRADMLSLSRDLAKGRNQSCEVLRDFLDQTSLSHEGQLTVPATIADWQLTALLPAIGGQAGPASLKAVHNCRSDLGSGVSVAIGTGVLAQQSGQTLVLSRDPVAITGRKDGTLSPSAVRLDIGPEPICWDGRFLFSGEAGVVNPERRGHHAGYRVLYGRDVTVRNLVAERLQALTVPDPSLMG